MTGWLPIAVVLGGVAVAWGGLAWFLFRSREDDR